MTILVTNIILAKRILDWFLWGEEAKRKNKHKNYVFPIIVFCLNESIMYYVEIIVSMRINFFSLFCINFLRRSRIQKIPET